MSKASSSPAKCFCGFKIRGANHAEGQHHKNHCNGKRKVPKALRIRSK